MIKLKRRLVDNSSLQRIARSFNMILFCIYENLPELLGYAYTSPSST